MSSQAVVVREIGGATIATLLYAPWPVRWQLGQPIAYRPTGVPVMPSAKVLRLAWGFAPSAFLTQLLNLPSNRATQWWLPVPFNAPGAAMKWSWVQGVWLPPAELATWHGQDWDRVDASLANANEV